MVFLDHAATSAMDPRILEQLEAELQEPLNASSVHKYGQQAKARMEKARKELANLIGANPKDVVFTSSASEANNLAIRGLFSALERRGNRFHAYSSQLEHSCVKETLNSLSARENVLVSNMDVDPDGRVRLPHARQPADLLCLMAVQNETGVLQNLEDGRQWAREHDALWLCDITQAFGLLEIDVSTLGAGLVSFSSHKVAGPPGVGALAGPGLSRLDPLITGGPQENEMRAGTQPVALVSAFVQAALLARRERQQRHAHLAALEDAFLAKLREDSTPFQLNGEKAPRLPGFLNLSFPGRTGADLVIALDAQGFCVSSGSACATGVMETSDALAAMFPDDPKRAAGAVRITPGPENTIEEMLALAEAIGRIVPRPAR